MNRLLGVVPRGGSISAGETVLHFHGPLDTVATGLAGGISAAFVLVAALPTEAASAAPDVLAAVGGLSGYAAVLMTGISVVLVKSINKFFGDHTLKILALPGVMETLQKDVASIRGDVTALRDSFDSTEDARHALNLETGQRISKLEGKLQGMHHDE